MRWIASPRRPALTSYGRPSIIPNSHRLKTAGRWSNTIAQHNVTRRWPDAVSILRMGLPKSRPQHAKRQSLLCARKKIGIGGRIWKSQKSKVLGRCDRKKSAKSYETGYSAPTMLKTGVGKRRDLTDTALYQDSNSG